eukprot:3426885-Prymnesium_polylepis.1
MAAWPTHTSGVQVDLQRTRSKVIELLSTPLNETGHFRPTLCDETGQFQGPFCKNEIPWLNFDKFAPASTLDKLLGPSGQRRVGTVPDEPDEPLNGRPQATRPSGFTEVAPRATVLHPGLHTFACCARCCAPTRSEGCEDPGARILSGRCPTYRPFLTHPRRLCVYTMIDVATYSHQGRSRDRLRCLRKVHTKTTWL